MSKPDDWVFGDFDGGRYIRMRSIHGKDTVKHLDYILVDGIKFVNESKIHDERVRLIAEQEGGR